MATRPTLLARDWLITTEHYLSAEAGAAVLRAGGNAVDAAAAAILADSVLNPHMLTLGGELVMLVHEGRSGQAHVLNGHTEAPRGLTMAEGHVPAIVVDERRGILRGGADPRGEVASVSWTAVTSRTPTACCNGSRCSEGTSVGLRPNGVANSSGSPSGTSAAMRMALPGGT